MEIPLPIRSMRLLPMKLALACTLAAGLPVRALSQAEELVSQAREVQGAVAEIRGLPFLHSVAMAVKGREAIRAYAVGRLDREYTSENFRAKTESLIAWGFVRRPFDLRAFYAELLAEQIGGYYDPFEGVFFIADWLPGLLQKPIMAHELTHALQDQHFDLKPLLRGVKSNDDATLAGAAVVEGEGLAVMIDYALRSVGLTFESLPDLESAIDTQLVPGDAAFRVYASAPPIIKETLLFPYLKGLLFVRAVKSRGGWQSVSTLYRDLPASTEQVLWPEKYLGERDPPTPIALPDVSRLLGRGWRRIDSNVLGELGTRVALERAGTEEGLAAARGWDGDRYDLYERNKGETALVSVSIWDEEEEAAEFESVLRKVLESDAATTESHHVLRAGARVVTLLNVAGGQADRVTSALLAGTPPAPVP